MQSEFAGRVIGRYSLLRKIGEGGMGVVFEGRETDSQRRVAMKSLRGSSDDHGDRRSRLMREARLTEALEHPGIVRVFEVLPDGDEVFVVMEYVEGESLRARLDALKARGEKLTVAEATRIAREVSEAVSHAHQRGVVHRDLKPENVMLSPERARVLDFGLAKLREIDGGLLYDAQTQSNVTVEGQVLGTPAYMAPEQARGQEVGFRADVFSLAVVLYEMLTGERPFTGGSTADVLAAITRDEPPPPSTRNPEVPQELDALVLRCLAKKSEARPAMAELALSLAQVDPRPARNARRWLLPVLVIALAAVAGGGVWRQVTSRSTVAAIAAPSATVAAADAGTTATSDAERAFAAAVEDEHAGAEDAAMLGFERATKLDPDHATAHLRVAVRDAFFGAENARRHFARAVARRDRLSAIDDELLEAWRPVFQRDPPDLDGWVAAMRAVAQRHPTDARMANELAKALDAAGDFRGAADAASKAAAIDPRYALALATLAQEQMYLGNFAAAHETVEQCLAASPSASWCIWVGEFLDSNAGDCAANESRARARIAADPTSPDAYKALAFSFAALGRPEKAIREACDRAAQRTAEGFPRERLDLNLQLRVAAMFGRFEEADQIGARLRTLVESRTDSGDHAVPSLMTAELKLEMGEPEAAGVIARDFLDRKDVWLENPLANDYALANDYTAPLLAVARHTGAMSESDYAKALSDWRSRWAKSLRGDWRRYLWVYGYAQLASTKEEGVAALKALESLGPIPAFIADGDVPLAGVGRALWLGGRTDDAVPYLREATRNCDALPHPFTWVQSHAWLGDALAQTGDVKGACDAYGVVIQRWGAAKKSVTARHARERMAALHCPVR